MSWFSHNGGRARSLDRIPEGGRATRQSPTPAGWTACSTFLGALLVLGGCAAKVPEGALVVTQNPLNRQPANSLDVLDLRYPPGSRVVLVAPPYHADQARVLSTGLVAAGDPVVCPSGQRVFFAGKADPGGSWQIYQAKLNGGAPVPVTRMEGGAMDPAVMAKGDLVFSSPVPKPGQTWKTSRPAALFAQTPGQAPRRLTFGSSAAVEPTVLGDGRILFVSAGADTTALPSLGLFTIQNDGTELTEFALDQDGAPIVHRPRELPDRRVSFVASSSDEPGTPVTAEAVRTARPFASRGPLFPFPTGHCSSVEPDGQGGLLVSLDLRGSVGGSMSGSSAIYRVSTEASQPGTPFFDDPKWNEVEAVPLAAHSEPMGHMSAVTADKKSGTILCLDANFTRRRSPGEKQQPAAKIRVLTSECPGGCRPLGELVPQADGSFMAEVPADIPIGFETLDERGEVLHRLAPYIWVRPGENRSCVGCHQPHNRSPRNVRPLAVTVPPVVLAGPPQPAAQHP